MLAGCKQEAERGRPEAIYGHRFSTPMPRPGPWHIQNVKARNVSLMFSAVRLRKLVEVGD